MKKHNPELILIQETKKDEFDSDFIKSLWSSKEIGWEFVESYGKSGGILTMWDDSKIVVTESMKGGYSPSVKCLTFCRKVFWVTNVYGRMIIKNKDLYGLNYPPSQVAAKSLGVLGETST